MPLLLLLFIIISEQNKRRKLARLQQIIKKRKTSKGAKIMNELLQKYIGKECLVYTINTQLAGVVASVENGWLRLEDPKAGDEELVNLDYIIRIREYPRKKNGNKKSVVLD